jgi:hypothetical protein
MENPFNQYLTRTFVGTAVRNFSAGGVCNAVAVVPGKPLLRKGGSATIARPNRALDNGGRLDRGLHGRAA